MESEAGAPRILLLNGSGRANGNTSKALHLLAEALRRRAPDARIVRLGIRDLRIEQCIGCRACFDRGEGACAHHDRIGELESAIAASHLVVMASPVYLGDVSGIVKAALDRLAYVAHRPRFHRQGVFLLATTGGSPTRHAVRSMQTAWLAWGAHLLGHAGIVAGATSSRQEVASRATRRLERAARRMIAWYERGGWERPGFVSFMVFRIQQLTWAAEPAESVDAAWWRDHGWLERGARWYAPYRRRPLRVAAGRLVGSALARFFLG